MNGMKTMTRRILGAISLLSLPLAACSNLDTKEERALSGGAIGAGSGALVGAVAGGPVGAVVGAVIGGGAGAGTGALTTEDQVRIGRPSRVEDPPRKLSRNPSMTAPSTTDSSITTTN